MNRLAALLAVALLPAHAAAQIRMMRAMKIHPIGGYEWAPSSSFKFRGSGWCENGSFVDAAVLPVRRESTVASGGDNKNISLSGILQRCL